MRIELTCNERGFTLLQTLVASGILALGALAITNLFTSQNKENKRITQKISITDFQNAFIVALQDTDICKANLDASRHSYLVFDSTLPSPSLAVHEFRLGILPTSPLLAQDNLQISPGVSVASIMITNLTDMGPGSYSGEWIIKFNNTNPKERNFKNIKLGVQNFLVDSSNPSAVKISDCQPISSNAGSTNLKWSLNGNDTSSLGVDPWLGSISDHDIIFKRFNVEAGRLSTSNTSLGLNSLRNTGTKNLAIGVSSLRRNVSGEANTALGYEALLQNTSGSFNTFVGTNSGKNLSTQANNTGLGVRVLENATNVRVYNNTAIGPHVHYSSVGENLTTIGLELGSSTGASNISIGGSSTATTSGSDNIAIGNFSLLANSVGSSNVAVGHHSLETNNHESCVAIGFQSQIGTQIVGTTSSDNVSIGHSSLRNNIGGNLNSGLGVRALFSNTSGNQNTALGADALANSNGSDNTAAGSEALKMNLTGSENTAIGYQALLANLGSGNTALGFQALLTNTTGINNTAIGHKADVASANLNNATAIGNGAIVDSSNKIRLGNTAVTVVEAPVPVTVPSDIRLKENIKDYLPGLDFIKKLRPVTYQYKSDSERKIHVGFIAQEVLATKIYFPGLLFPDSPQGFFSLAYTQFVMPIINGVKEIWHKLNSLDNKLFLKKKRLQKLENILHAQEKEIIQLEKEIHFILKSSQKHE